jgi:hypothetical protein
LVWVNGEASGIAYHYDAYPHLVAVCAGFAVAPLSTLDDPIIDRLRAIYPRLDAAAAIALISLRVVDAWPSAGRRKRESQSVSFVSVLMARLVDRHFRVDAELPGDVRDFQQGSILVSPPSARLTI